MLCRAWPMVVGTVSAGSITSPTNGQAETGPGGTSGSGIGTGSTGGGVVVVMVQANRTPLTFLEHTFVYRLTKIHQLPTLVPPPPPPELMPPPENADEPPEPEDPLAAAAAAASVCDSALES